MAEHCASRACPRSSANWACEYASASWPKSSHRLTPRTDLARLRLHRVHLLRGCGFTATQQDVRYVETRVLVRWPAGAPPDRARAATRDARNHVALAQLGHRDSRAYPRDSPIVDSQAMAASAAGICSTEYPLRWATSRSAARSNISSDTCTPSRLARWIWISWSPGARAPAGATPIGRRKLGALAAEASVIIRLGVGWLCSTMLRDDRDHAIERYARSWTVRASWRGRAARAS